MFHPLALPLPENAAQGSPNHAKTVFLAEYAAQGSLSQISRQANRAPLGTRQRSALLSKGKPQVTKLRKTNNPNPSEEKRLLAAPKALSAPTKCPLRGISCQKGPSNPAFMTLARRFLPRTQSPCRIQRELSFAPHFSSFPCLSHSTLPSSAPSLLALLPPLFHTPHSSPSASCPLSFVSFALPALQAFHASRAPASEPFALSLSENANRGPDCRENASVWQKTPLGGLLQQGMSRSLGHIGKMLSHQERKTAGQRIIHRELPRSTQNPSLATRPPGGVFCQMSPASLQCPSVAHPSTPLGELFERPLGKLPERSTWRAFQAICLASLPNDPTVELPKPFFVFLTSTDKSEYRDATGEFETHIAVAP